MILTDTGSSVVAQDTHGACALVIGVARQRKAELTATTVVRLTRIRSCNTNGSEYCVFVYFILHGTFTPVYADLFDTVYIV